MTSVIAETIEILKEKSPTPLEEVWVDDLVIGIFFTGVKLSTGHGGCAFTPIGELPEAVCCPTSAARMPEAGNLDGKRTAIIGPTGSMIPDAFFKRRVAVMAGVRILNPDLMIKILKQGCSAYHLLKECSEKMAFVKV